MKLQVGEVVILQNSGCIPGDIEEHWGDEAMH
jgi:hypothetical protein